MKGGCHNESAGLEEPCSKLSSPEHLFALGQKFLPTFTSFQVLIYLLIRQNGNWRAWNDEDAPGLKKCFCMSGMRDVVRLNGRKMAVRSTRGVSLLCLAWVRKVVGYQHLMVKRAGVCLISLTVFAILQVGWQFVSWGKCWYSNA